MEDYNLHIAVVATDGSEHLPELIHLATSITELGHDVSFASTLSGLKAIRIDPSNPNSSKLELIPLQENNVREVFDTFVQQANQAVDWVLFDITTWWVPEVTEKFGIYSAYISFQSANTCEFLLAAINNNKIPSVDDLLPQNLGALKTYHFEEAKAVRDQLLKCDAQKVPLYSRIKKAINWCDVVALSSYCQIEDELPEELTKTDKKYFYCIGYLPQTTTCEVSSSKYVMNPATVQEWLDKINVHSVVYVALENKMAITDQQLDAIARGLVSSRLPFIWVTGYRQGGELKLPPGFWGRTIDYGLVCKEWLPPANILSHVSVGGFLTNGNWSAWIEALESGIPLILVPFPTDEVPNAKVREAKKLGCEVGRDATGNFDANHVAQALNFVMVDQGGNIVREQANAMRGVFRNLQTQYLFNFLDGLNEIKESREVNN
ncbi:hypothetical protein LUZ63_005503 [Rhynchospora breviuscula]|uniref:Uncharacterized protein n=1 Tax=Rhynchospora breviuscula TaxID=2022672 RepID=A0A9Q0CN84_9POAL|nr:hypothetical protein LUZ63_005503 [Rhynchospora breviuscula]